MKTIHFCGVLTSACVRFACRPWNLNKVSCGMNGLSSRTFRDRFGVPLLSRPFAVENVVTYYLPLDRRKSEWRPLVYHHFMHKRDFWFRGSDHHLRELATRWIPWGRCDWVNSLNMSAIPCPVKNRCAGFFMLMGSTVSHESDGRISQLRPIFKTTVHQRFTAAVMGYI